MNQYELFLRTEFYWIYACIFFMILEFKISGQIFFFLGIASGLLSLLVTLITLSAGTQLILFVSLSALLIMFMRHHLKVWIDKRTIEGLPPYKHKIVYYPFNAAIAITDINPGRIGLIKTFTNSDQAVSKQFILAGSIVRPVKLKEELFEVELVDKYPAFYFSPGKYADIS